jgi:uncharacterized protein YjbI with pentapeptide repeats
MNLDKFWNLLDRGETNFSGGAIQDVDFHALEFKDLDFGNTDMSGAKMRKTTFENCNFSGVNLSNCDLDRVSFTNCQLMGTKFDKCIAVELHFAQCDLSETQFVEAQMGDIYFHHSNLSRSQWRQASWCGGFTECDLTQARMERMCASSVEIVNTIYPNGVSGDLSWYGLEGNGEPPTPLPSKTAVSDLDQVELRSAVGIDYSTLRKLLSECRWDAANDKTAELLWEILEDASSYIEPDEIDRIPCIDLITIDRLWIESSWGHFGLTVQKNVWISIYGGHECDPDLYESFCETIWGGITVEKLQDERSIKLVPPGSYPDILLFCLISPEQEKILANLYRRLSECQVKYQA